SKVFEDEKYKAVIMENHGVVLGGGDLMDAYQRFETLEFCCRTIINAEHFGGITTLTDAQIADFHSRIPHSIMHFMDVQHPSDERDMRGQMVEMIHRSCDQGLMISTYGTVSMRWKGDDFLITATGKPRWDMQREDIVQIRDGMAEVGKIPSRSVALHQRIYQKNPHINSIITTQTPNLMAFAVSGKKFDVRTIPESWIFLKDVPRLEFNEHYENPDKVADILSKNRAIMVNNDCFIVTGDALMQTFDYLEVAEFSAHSLVMATAIGQLKPITDKEIEELRVAFNVK
ncbi:MAG: class II aldolase/adducin family protein, partial [Bacteroidales bacterium]|nr:class II aldolase/adducin family protein [Bacteroidales bacterium]